MPIKAACSSCGHSFSAASKFAGKKVKCPKCKKSLMIPNGKKSPSSSAEPTAKIAVKCDCGKSFSAKPELAGKKVKCPGCGKPILIKAAAAKRSAPKAEPTLDDLFDEVGFATGDGPGKRCPECRAEMKPEAIICIDCGYNENLGKRMVVKRPVTSKERAKKTSEHDDAEAAKQKKKGGWWGRRK